MGGFVLGLCLEDFFFCLFSPKSFSADGPNQRIVSHLPPFADGAYRLTGDGEPAAAVFRARGIGPKGDSVRRPAQTTGGGRGGPHEAQDGQEVIVGAEKTGRSCLFPVCLLDFLSVGEKPAAPVCSPLVSGCTGVPIRG